MSSTHSVRYLAALMIVVVGVVHLQQYTDFIKDVPTIGTLFLLNGAAAGVIVIMLAVPRLRLLGAAAGLGLCVGSLVSIALSFTTSGIFDYTEPDLRTPIIVAIASEVIALAALVTVAAFGRPAGA
jgi:uncharacterized membrane protein YdcZ (DUF606 family)